MQVIVKSRHTLTIHVTIHGKENALKNADVLEV
jgi:hypothetical protein